MRPTFDTINDATGFANGDKFGSFQEVRDYFRVESMRQMGFDDALDQETLDAYGNAVIDNGWHCEFPD